VYKGHPYEHLANGNEASISKATGETVKAHLATLRETSRLEIVVVGNVEAPLVQQLVQQHFGKLPRGNYVATPLPVPQFDAAKALVFAPTEPLPTNYIEASFIGPQWSDAHFAPGILAMRLLRARLFEEVRTKRNLSYAPSARFSWGGEITRGSLYVTAVKANETMKVMFDEARRLQTELVPAKVLAGTKAVYLTDHLMGNEATNGQAGWLALCDIVGGDWRLSRTLPDAIKAVTAEQIQAFANVYLNRFQTVVLGDESQVDRALFESL
jgi:predicted Zn-dependent peptidase